MHSSWSTSRTTSARAAAWRSPGALRSRRRSPGTSRPPAYDHVVATRDHHIDPGHHFAEQPDFLETWPAHCVVGTGGVELHEALDREPLEAIFDKGEYAAAYSGFEGSADGVPLAHWLREHGVDAVDVVGLATDHCVRATALDAVGNGFTTRVLLHLTAGVSEASTDAALDQLRTAGVELEGEVHRP